MSKAKGSLFIVAAPSGAGKTSLVRALVGTVNGLEISISHTTRPPRPSDVEGSDYFFISQHQFESMLQQKLFLEHAMVYGHYYGTSREWTLEKLNQGIDVILEIDWQGAKQIRQSIPNTVSIFILPPSLSVLQERLQQRKQDNPEVIARRMSSAREEMSHYAEFDYLIVNENFNQALTDLQYIINAKRLSCLRQKYTFESLLRQLLGF